MHHPSRLNYYIFILSLILVQSPAPANSFVRKEHRYGRLSPSINAKTKLSTFITNESFDQHGPPVVVGSAVGTEAIPQHHRMPTKFSTFISNERFNQHGPPVVGSGVGTEAIQQDHRMPTRASSRFGGIFHFDRQKFAKLGIAFALTYNIISNICGSVTFSIAWFMASKRTGLSPLAAGQWRSLVAAYGSLYVFVTLTRPLRFALALTLTKHTEHFIEQTQSRLGCTRATAIGLKVSLGLMLWLGCVSGGVLLASTLAGVPIY